MSESEAKLVYRVSSRIAWATQRNLVLKNKPKKRRKKKRTILRHPKADPRSKNRRASTVLPSIILVLVFQEISRGMELTSQGPRMKVKLHKPERQPTEPVAYCSALPCGRCFTQCYGIFPLWIYPQRGLIGSHEAWVGSALCDWTWSIWGLGGNQDSSQSPWPEAVAP